MNQVEAHYNRNAEREWERLERHRTEYAVTCRVLDEFLPHPPGRILDVGGGPGRYTLRLTKMGYHVTLLDLSQASLDLALEKATQEGVYLPVPIRGDATALPAEFDGLFDAVLLMGPLYHLLAADDRLAAVREAHRVLRPGGLLFAAFITRFAPLRDLAVRLPQWILDHPERFQQLLDEGLNPAYESSNFPDSYFILPEDIAPLMETDGFHMEALQGCEGLIAGHEETVNALDGELWAAWVDLNYRLGREPSLYGAADHLLYVGSKSSQPAGETVL
jgi:ubiquinone/menaquinone biosynthesis C-methylase UbiE